jgi:aminopeptidase-like protein
MFDLLENLYPLHRTLNHIDNEVALLLINNFIGNKNFNTLKFESDKEVLDWKIPKRFHVNHAYLKDINGNIIVDFNDNILHLVSYSVSINKTLTFSELKKHLHYDEYNIDSIPWVYKYYDKTWGFCISKNQYDKLDKEANYIVDISTDFQDKPMVIGELLLKGKFEQEILIVVDICHPMQVNDSITGSVIAAKLAKKLENIKLMNSIRFLFVPETIGTIAWLSENLEKKDKVLYALTFDCLGNNNILKFQHTLYADNYIDNIAKSLLIKEFQLADFREFMSNDELYLEAPGIGIPTASFSRAPFKEYHTTADSPAVIDKDILLKTYEIIENIVIKTAIDYIPKQKIVGFIFLSKYNLWNNTIQNQPYYLKKVCQLLNGNHSIYEISNVLNIDFYELYDIIENFTELDLIEKLPISRDVHKQPKLK